MEIIQYKYVYNNSLPKYSSLTVPGLPTKDKNISLNTTLITKPIFINENPSDNRNNLKKDTYGFSGIYLWYNNKNGKCYIGSAVNLYRRISNYSQTQTAHLKRYYPIIIAINKYVLNSFTLVILELRGKSKEDNRLYRLQREDYYLSTYCPEYNILEKGRSSFNYKHTIETRAKIRAKALIRDKFTIVYSKEFIAKQKSDKYGRNNPMLGKKWNEERRKKVAKPVYVYDSKTHNLLHYYPVTIIALKELKMSHHTLKRCLFSNEVFKNQIFSRTPYNKD